MTMMMTAGFLQLYVRSFSRDDLFVRSPRLRHSPRAHLFSMGAPNKFDARSHDTNPKCGFDASMSSD
eukprot:scaffold32148_cov58-Skeletonema_marinoi.AAC.1